MILDIPDRAQTEHERRPEPESGGGQLGEVGHKGGENGTEEKHKKGGGGAARQFTENIVKIGGTLPLDP